MPALPAPERDMSDDGMRVRREVLGDEHVDRAESAKDEFTADFQELITKYAWGEIWSRDGLDRRMRSAVARMLDVDDLEPGERRAQRIPHRSGRAQGAAQDDRHRAAR